MGDWGIVRSSFALATEDTLFRLGDWLDWRIEGMGMGEVWNGMNGLWIGKV